VEPKVSKLLCAPELSLCGNGMTDAGEACDDGNTTTETECPYGEAPCARCDATCSTDLNLTGPRCGDGSVDSLFEQCDDNNDSSCGTCNAPCKVFQLSSASGFILAVQGASLTDGETFTLDYGFSSTVFEFDTVFDGVAPGNAQIVVSPAWSAAQVAEEITSQINNTPPFIVSASRQSNMVALTSIQGSPGNQPIIETVSDTEFVATGMQGGAGRDCLSGVGCGSDDDCASGTCGSQVPGECD
jgi:cysteine-rich repeat protein